MPSRQSAMAAPPTTIMRLPAAGLADVLAAVPRAATGSNVLGPGASAWPLGSPDAGEASSGASKVRSCATEDTKEASRDAPPATAAPKACAKSRTLA